MVMATETVITEDEAALYDRQIRLWGLDAQNRLRNANVLLVGVDGLGAEIAKNLMLVGLKSLTIIDDSLVSASEEGQFFIAAANDKDGKTRAEATREKCQLLNPLVKLKIDSGPISAKEKQYFEQFSLVCLVGESKSVCESVNKLCHSCLVQFLCGRVDGWFAFAFFDLGDNHQYLDEVIREEVETNDVTLDRDEDDEIQPPPIKKRTVDNETPAKNQPKKTTMKFTRLEAVHKMDWATKSTVRLGQKMPPAFYATSVVEQYRSKYGSLIRPLNEEKLEDQQTKMRELWESQLIKCGVNDFKKIKIDFKTFYNHCFGQLSPACAVTGGFIAQEIIKGVSCKDRPMDNTFYFSALESSASVIKLPPA